MSTRLASLLLAVPSIICFAQGPKPRTYPSPDKTHNATVTPAGGGGEESVVEVRTARGETVWKLSLQSPDGEHGEGAAKAGWTPDSRFFVFSTGYSGGHSPMMHPTRFWDRKQNKVFNLANLGAAVTDSKFYVSAPHTLTTEVRNCKDPDSDAGLPLIVNLSEAADLGKLPENAPCPAPR